jgi:hypothetical protein
MLLSSQASALAAVDVSEGNLENVRLVLTTGVTVPGRLSVEGQELTAMPGYEQVGIEFDSTTPSRYLQPPRRMRADGAFSLDNVPFGEYRLAVHRLPPNFYVKEARLDGVDVLGQAIQLSGSDPGSLQIVLSSKGGRVVGAVVDNQSQPVSGIEAVLIPDRLRNQIQLFKTAVSGPDGGFTITGVAPGDYKLFAWEATEPFAYFNPDFLRQWEQQGTAVTVSESSTATARVQGIPASP